MPRASTISGADRPVENISARTARPPDWLIWPAATILISPASASGDTRRSGAVVAPPEVEDAWFTREKSSPRIQFAAFCGSMMLELIQQHNDAPSVYKETIEKRGYGFHHWGVATNNFDADVARLRAAGYAEAFFARVPTGGRVAYMDTTAHLSGMIEYIELGPGFDPAFGAFYRATIAWDGKDPVRSFV